jgi:hypothetical protein
MGSPPSSAGQSRSYWTVSLCGVEKRGPGDTGAGEEARTSSRRSQVSCWAVSRSNHSIRSATRRSSLSACDCDICDLLHHMSKCKGADGLRRVVRAAARRGSSLPHRWGRLRLGGGHRGETTVVIDQEGPIGVEEHDPNVTPLPERARRGGRVIMRADDDRVDRAARARLLFVSL